MEKFPGFRPSNFALNIKSGMTPHTSAGLTCFGQTSKSLEALNGGRQINEWVWKFVGQSNRFTPRIQIPKAL